MNSSRTERAAGCPSASPLERPVPLVSPADLINPMLRVADVATNGVRTCSPASTVLEAVLVFRDAACGFVPIVEEGRAVGILTDRDVALALADHERSLAETPVGALMSTNVPSIDSGATLDLAVEALKNRGVRRLMVNGPDGRLLGALSWSDLVSHISERALRKIAFSVLDRP